MNMKQMYKLVYHSYKSTTLNVFLHNHKWLDNIGLMLDMLLGLVDRPVSMCSQNPIQ